MPLTTHRPSGRSLPVAGYSPRLSLPTLAGGTALGLTLAATLWWAGHTSSAAAVVVLTAAIVSAASYLAMEETRVGEDWISNRFFGQPVVVDAATVQMIELPSSEVGLSYLIFRGRRHSVRVDLSEMFRRPALGHAVLQVVATARNAGAQVEPQAAALLDSLRHRLH